MFSQMKDTKHIRRDSNFDAWVTPQGPDLGALGVPMGSNLFFKHGHEAYQIDGDDEQNRSKIFILRSNWCPCTGGKPRNYHEIVLT